MNTQRRGDIVARAKKKAKKFAKLRADPRFKKVIGRLKHERLIEAADILPTRAKLLLDDVIWVGEHLEPRVLELLPAIVLKKPALLLFQELPDDLKEACNQMRRNDTDFFFRGIKGEQCAQWVPRVGRKGKGVTALKTFRLGHDDLSILRRQSRARKVSETEVLRLALTQLSTK